jgi:hypothetical protein
MRHEEYKGYQIFVYEDKNQIIIVNQFIEKEIKIDMASSDEMLTYAQTWIDNYKLEQSNKFVQEFVPDNIV